MPQSLASVLLHIIFSTKNRKELIDDQIQSKLFAYLSGICRKNGSEAFRVGGTANHIHIACSLPRTITISKLVEEIKKSSSIWMKKQKNAKATHFEWQPGYGVFSLGKSQLATVIQYIDNQQKHHQNKSFEKELLEILDKYNINYDEKFLWD
jgi:REP element-mobilizing transposase RayT